jgi:hypothetical protein
VPGSAAMPKLHRDTKARGLTKKPTNRAVRPRVTGLAETDELTEDGSVSIGRQPAPPGAESFHKPSVIRERSPST